MQKWSPPGTRHSTCLKPHPSPRVPLAASARAAYLITQMRSLSVELHRWRQGGDTSSHNGDLARASNLKRGTTAGLFKSREKMR
ncbi:hypothetical protein PVAP13_3KG264749 [Panicum virgatum]|uniref:Uncharacterized protein n=1 Tax=Panicum virgatum TaxID=38727 RepID=A0A8T0V300_PANVG|nr:hypothetical protein PVAP13_3KG264749 [Panicum virgatum]